ncbi:uncharacterized protein LOC125863954 [Solanum stenotomum]|uniref:uncharacterized protein LOC125863954 n=1 Tax=Solanum stenotomum TaxID=172797 RepID=UPI0020CFF8F3|nr:uncharacterized protein LOC125863954 [Solanum stenotomum]
MAPYEALYGRRYRSPVGWFEVGEPGPRRAFGGGLQDSGGYGGHSIEKVELAGYQLKDAAQVWYTQWNDNRPIRVGSISWEVYKKAFLDRFFPREKREAKVEKFINLRQRGMSVQEYSLKFTKLSKHAPSLVSNPRDEMSRFVTGVADTIEEEWRVTMLHDNMDISRLMVYAQQVEESRLRKKSREVKRESPDDGNSSKSKFEGQSGPRFKKKFSNQSSSNAPKPNKDKVPNSKPQGGNRGGSSMEKPTCAKCGKKHKGKCLAGISVCYGCGKSGHQLKIVQTVQPREERVIKLQQVVLMPILPRRIAYMPSNIEVIKRGPRTLLPVCY